MIGVLVLLLEVPHHVTCGVAGLWLVGLRGCGLLHTTAFVPRY